MRGTFTRVRRIKDISVVEKLIALKDTYGLNVIKLGVGGEYASLQAWSLHHPYTGLSDNIIINQKETKLEITTRYLEGVPCTYVLDLNLESDESITKGQRCFAVFQKYFKVPDAKDYHIAEFDKYYSYEHGKYVCSAKPVLNYNKKYENQELKDCYEYDLNSAYASILIGDIPDLEHPTYHEKMVKVNKNEIGFLLDDDLTLVDTGDYADITFPKIASPDGLKLFCNKYFMIKQNTSGNARNEAKAMLNFPIGYCQRKNPFFRAYIVHKCNRVIRSLLDENTLFYNTDAIFSKVRRKDLKIGRGIGEFKEIHCNTLRYLGNTYQIDEELPMYRGIPKAYFKRFEAKYGRKFNMLTDKVDERKCLYSFNFNTLRLEKNYEEID